MRFYGKNLVAEYMRLSREDGDKVESDSISNQRDLITDFLSHHDELKFVGEYVDDGYSGTNFERPAFKRLMEDVKAGKVNCIIVKDLSRFGRNYIETGRYLEKVFPFMGVRFISIIDNYDSAGEDNDADRISLGIAVDAAFLQHQPHPAVSIGTKAALSLLRDDFCKSRVFLRSAQTMDEIIVSASGYLKEATHNGYRIFLSVPVDYFIFMTIPFRCAARHQRE